MADSSFNVQSFSNQVAATFGLNQTQFANQVSTLPVQNDANIMDLGQSLSQSQGTSFVPNSTEQEAAAWGVPTSTVTGAGYDPTTGSTSGSGTSAGAGAGTAGTGTAGAGTTGAGTTGAPSSLKTLFTGSLINVVFIIVGILLMVIGAFMMVSRNA